MDRILSGIKPTGQLTLGNYIFNKQTKLSKVFPFANSIII